MKASALRLDKTLIRREFWENRSLWMVPAVVIGILTVLSIWAMIMMLTGHTHMGDGNDVQTPFDNVPDLRDADDVGIAAFVRASAMFFGTIFSVLMQIVIFFYMLDSLYADRRDRSVLFWRSMPVSDTRTVLSKLATACIASVGITFVAAVAFQLISLVLELIAGSILGMHPWVLLAHPGAFIGSWLLLAYGLIVQTIWYLPYYGWNMLASSWAKKVPLLWAVLVPLGIMFAEWWVFRSSHLAHVYFGHAVSWTKLAFNFAPLRFGHHDFGDVDINTSVMDIGNIGALLASPALWIGLGLAAAFTYGAIWLRRKRSEI